MSMINLKEKMGLGNGFAGEVYPHENLDGVTVARASGVELMFGDGKQVSVDAMVSEEYDGPKEFDAVVIGDPSDYEQMKNSVVPVGERWRNAEDVNLSLYHRIQIAALSVDINIREAVKANVGVMTVLANSNGQMMVEGRQAYKGALRNLFKLALDGEETRAIGTVIMPLRAGLVAAHEARVLNGDGLMVVEKRLPLVKGNPMTGSEQLGVGISMRDGRAGWDSLARLKGKEATVVEGCLATSFTVKRLLQTAVMMDAKPRKLRVLAGVVTQQGVESLSEYCEQERIVLEVLAGGIAYVMNGKCYIMTEDSHKYLVGDAGDFLWPNVGDGWVNMYAGKNYVINEVDDRGGLVMSDKDSGDTILMDPVELYLNKGFHPMNNQ